MLCILNHTTEPYFNIAAEEYLLKNFDQDIFMLYRNEPSIIIGKHQNTFSEINYWFVKNKKVKVVRRLSGGGTVFHDLGNVNFTFIQNGKEGTLVDFVKFTEPIIQSLQKMGVNASRSGRNDIMVEGFKISGNAEHVYKNRTLHHGTLLFSSKLDDLRQGLQSNGSSYTDKAVKSFRSPVTNISDYLKNWSVGDFLNTVQASVLEILPQSDFHKFTDGDMDAINKLVSEKYSTWEWNYGYSPKFKVLKQGIIADRTISIYLQVEKGIITNIQCEDPTISCPDFISGLLGSSYNDEIIRNTLHHTLSPDEIKDWLNLLF
jgi:lipoate-protein ligase A